MHIAQGTIEENHQSYVNKDKLRHCQNVSFHIDWLQHFLLENASKEYNLQQEVRPQNHLYSQYSS